MSNQTSRPSILCVDNDPITADWIAAMLARAEFDCNIETATKGRDAFGRLVSGKIDLCVLEYALPDMTGVQLCGLLRQVGSTVPVIFFSTLTRNIDRTMAFDAGADEYLSKPYDIGVLPDTVKFLLKRRIPAYQLRHSEPRYAHAA